MSFHNPVVSMNVFILFFSGFGMYSYTDSAITLIGNKDFKSFSSIAKSAIIKVPKSRAWKRMVPQAKTVSIIATVDKTRQPALFYDSKSNRDKPLLVALHSWSEDYQQHFSIPYGMWAVKNDWVLIHPHYRGAFNNPQSTASESAIRDILDALQYAKEHARIDTTRIYITGFSGGGMMTLIMVGRYPDLWAGAVAWVPVYDLAQWYQYTKNATHDYSRQISSSCGGPPLAGSRAEEECKKRSVSTYLKDAQGKNVPVYIATGVNDRFVPPSHSLLAFNDLADEKDLISDEAIDSINKNHAIPEYLSGVYNDTLFTNAGLPLVFEKRSNTVVLKIFDGGHDILYNAGLLWLSNQRK